MSTANIQRFMNRRGLSGAMFAAALALGVLFLYSFNMNLHCTQYSSFGAAIFDLQPHEEEGLDSPLPLIYLTPYSIPLRVVIALCVLGALIGPGCASTFALIRRVRTRRTWWAVVAPPLVCAAAAFLPTSLVGERAVALLACSAGTGVLCAIIAAVGLRLAVPRRQVA